jgi:hypothetical protein
LISQVEKLRAEHEQKIKKHKPKDETQLERDDPPPDDFHQVKFLLNNDLNMNDFILAFNLSHIR